MLSPGQQIAHFEIVRKLGEGGMGAVFLAEDKKLHRQVALKVVSAEFADDKERLERFYREARTAAQIADAYVTRIFDIGTAKNETTSEDFTYIVMEYVAGESLTDYLTHSKPDLATRVRLAEKIAVGLSAAHKLNIVHRDIKPDNVIIDESGEPKILDFGLAKPLNPVQMSDDDDSTKTVSNDLTKVGKIMGTVSYMSPEQLRGEAVDTRSDVFSFGILLYRLITGELPFSAPTQVEAMSKILQSEPEPLSKFDADIPADLERVVKKCLQKDADDRYQDTRDVVVDLRTLRRNYDSGISDTITGIGHAQPQAKFYTVKLGWIGGLTLVVLLAIAWFAFGDLLGGSQGAKVQAATDALAIIGFENKTGDESLDWLQTGLPEILLTDLSQIQNAQLISQQRIVECLPLSDRYSYTHEQCVDAAAGLGATRLLSGTYFKLGDKIRIDARLEDISTGTIILAEKVIGDDAFALVDSLSGKIAVALNMGELENVQTFASSPEAFRVYHAGMDLFGKGDLDSAIILFQQALEIDTTFALPYMRIGMSHLFSGRPAEGARYLMLAKQHEQGLPVRERSLLDAYVDTWVTNNYDHAFTKMETLVRNYPGDAEIRTIYALFIETFRRDTTAAFAQLDTVLATYPTATFAIDNYIALLTRHNQYERAEEMARRLVAINPDSYSAKETLANIYALLGRDQDAFQMYSDLLEEYPKQPSVIDGAVRIAIRVKKFDTAREFLDRKIALVEGDPFELRESYNERYNLELWAGNFKRGLEYLRKALEQAKLTEDNQLINASYSQFSAYYERLDMIDSALYYKEQCGKYAIGMGQIDVPLQLVSLDASRADEERPVFRQYLERMKSKLPSDMWPFTVALDSIFEGFARTDTAAIIAGLEALISGQVGVGGGNERQLAIMRIATGDYGDARKILEKFIAGPERSSVATTRMTCLYWAGVAAEGQGDTSSARQYFTELVDTWGNADVTIHNVADARARLAKMTG